MNGKTLRIKLDGQPTNALVNTGGSVSIVSCMFCRKLRNVVTQGFGCVLHGAGRSLLNLLRMGIARVAVGEVRCRAFFAVLEPCMHDAILGFHTQIIAHTCTHIHTHMG